MDQKFAQLSLKFSFKKIFILVGFGYTFLLFEIKILFGSKFNWTSTQEYFGFKVIGRIIK